MKCDVTWVIPLGRVPNTEAGHITNYIALFKRRRNAVVVFLLAKCWHNHKVLRDIISSIIILHYAFLFLIISFTLPQLRCV
jgi:hypothetical protein